MSGLFFQTQHAGYFSTSIARRFTAVSFVDRRLNVVLLVIGAGEAIGGIFGFKTRRQTRRNQNDIPIDVVTVVKPHGPTMYRQYHSELRHRGF